jgi:hypothetical protein
MMPLPDAPASFAAQMRLGSLEITAALAVVAVCAARPRVRAATEIGRLMPMEVALEILERNGSRTQRARPPFELGRAAEADVVVRDPEVSRRHARFESRDGVVYVEDLASSNGTFLNGHRVSEAIEVREGDAIDVGTTRLLVTSVRPA